MLWLGRKIMQKLICTAIALLMSMSILSGFAQEEDLQTFLVVQTVSSYQIWRANLDNPKISSVITSFPLNIQDSLEEFLPEDELLNVQKFSQETERPFTVDLRKKRIFKTTIEDSSISSDGTFLAVVVSYTYCLSMYDVPDSCFGLSEIILIDASGHQTVLGQLSIHSVDTLYVRNCGGHPLLPFYSVYPFIHTWTPDNHYLIVSSSGRGNCYRGGWQNPIVALAISNDESAFQINQASDVLVSSDNQFLAVLQTTCLYDSTCDSPALIYSLSNLHGDPVATYQLEGLTASFLYWDALNNSIVLFATATDEMEERERLITLNIETGETIGVKRNYFFHGASSGDGYTIFQDQNGILYKLTITGQEVKKEPISSEPVDDWLLLPHESILIKDEVGSWWLLNVNQGTSNAIDFHLSPDAIILNFQ
jgi:hypothetical protein